MDDRQRTGIVRVGQRLADRDLGEAGDGDDVARSGLGGVAALERLGDVELGDLGLLEGAVATAPRDLLALADRPLVDAADGEAPDVGAGVEVGDERLERVAVLVLRRRDRGEQRLEQRLEVGARFVQVERGGAGATVRVDDRELDLLLVGVEVDEQLVDLVEHLVDARVGAVDLVDDEDDRQVALERLAQDEARLRQRPLGRVDEQQHAVDHEQAPLDLTAEVGVARRVDDVDLRALVPDARVLGEDRDALLALEVVGVHDALVDVLVLAEGAGLPQHGVDEGRLAVVDVGDDGDVAELGADGHRGTIVVWAGCSSTSNDPVPGGPSSGRTG